LVKIQIREKYADPIFLIFSDDMKWCRKHILGFDVVYTGNNLLF